MTNKDSLWITVSSEIWILQKTHILKTHCFNKWITLLWLPVRSLRNDTNRHIHAEIKANILWLSEQTERAYVWFVKSASVLSEVPGDFSLPTHLTDFTDVCVSVIIVLTLDKKSRMKGVIVANYATKNRGRQLDSTGLWALWTQFFIPLLNLCHYRHSNPCIYDS